jgi:putative transposase
MATDSRIQLIKRLCNLPEQHLDRVAELFTRLELEVHPGGSSVPAALPVLQCQDVRHEVKPWPHAPTHRVSDHGTYMVTGGTLYKAHYFSEPESLDFLELTLLRLARESGWQLEAWAVFSNHYHFVAHVLQGATLLGEFIKKLHGATAHEINRRHAEPERQVWYNFWDTELTYEKSYLARLNYVHQNPVKHGLVPVANQYRWCSASWFEQAATPAQVETIYRFKTDQIQVYDDY